MVNEGFVMAPCRPCELSRLCQALATLDAILMPDWDLRYYSFNAHWGEGEMMASMRNGEGDNCFILFNPHGVFIKGHAVGMLMERPSTEPSLLETVPAEFHAALQEPAFSFEQATFCRWATWESEGWGVWPMQHSSHDDQDEARRVLSILDGDPRTYQAWAEGYYGKALVASAIDAIYAHRTLESDLVHALNPDRSMTDLAEEIREIGYPSILPGGGREIPGTVLKRSGGGDASRRSA